MKLYTIIGISAIAAFTLSSCGMEDEKSTGSDVMGALEMGVNVKQPVAQATSRAGVDTSLFPVSIVGTSTATSGISKEYATASVVPSKITLPVGDYTASSHTPGAISKKMTAPYYSGSENFTITKDIITQTTVTCKMQNSRIQLNYSDDFAEKFSDWKITLDDGSDTALPYDQTNMKPDPIYWLFGDKVSAVTVNFKGTSKSSGTISDSRVYTKKDAAEHYDEDSEYFTGGDALIINMKPATSPTGEVTIEIEVKIIFEDHTDEVDIPVNWDKQSITVTEPNGTSYLTNGITFTTGDNYPSDAAIQFKATEGINNLSLKVTSDNASFTTVATGLGLVADDGLDLTSSEATTKLGSYLTLPTKGTTDYTLTLTKILNLLKMYTGQHTFIMNITDAQGATKTETLVIKVKDGGGSDETITVTEPNGTSYLVNGVSIKTSDTVFPQDVVLDMDVANGIQNLFVSVTTTNSTFEGAAGLMGLTQGDGLDLTSSDALELENLFTLPIIGSKTYSFSLNDDLFTLLINYVGIHNFNLKIVDQNGNTKIAVLTVNVAKN